jgi:hypothetical protein
MEINIKCNDTQCNDTKYFKITIECNIDNSTNKKNKKIKLNEEESVNSITKMDYYNMYVEHEMSKGISHFHATVKFLMDETVSQKYKDLYRKNQNQIVEAMDLDPEPKLTYTKYIYSKSKY